MACEYGLKIAKRLYHDYLLPAQFENYEQILKAARKNNYSFETVSSFDHVISKGMLDHGQVNVRDPVAGNGMNGKKYLVLRRDIDTSAISICRVMLNLEKKYGARCSYFFRLSTFHQEFALEVEAAGGESSYHYEEIATYALMHHIKHSKDVLYHLPAIREFFLKNLVEFRRNSGLACTTVASHGDFINRKLGLSNTEILQSPEFRQRAGILREAYDEEQTRYITCRIADQSSVNFTDEALAAITRNEPVIYLLTHPRQWKSDFAANTKDNLIRAANGFRYTLTSSKNMNN